MPIRAIIWDFDGTIIDTEWPTSEAASREYRRFGLRSSLASRSGIEDSRHGVTAAKRAGMKAIAVPNRNTFGQDFEHADLVVDSLEGLDLESVIRGFGRVPA